MEYNKKYMQRNKEEKRKTKQYYDLNRDMTLSKAKVHDAEIIEKNKRCILLPNT